MISQVKNYSNDASSKRSLVIGLAILNCSVAQSPKSMSLQRSLQNGRNGLFGENSEAFLQLGQATVRAVDIKFFK